MSAVIRGTESVLDDTEDSAGVSNFGKWWATNCCRRTRFAQFFRLTAIQGVVLRYAHMVIGRR
jgi:hypothetical protein